MGYEGQERRNWLQRRIKNGFTRYAYDPEPIEVQTMLFALVTAFWFSSSPDNAFNFNSAIYHALLMKLPHLFWAVLFYIMFAIDFISLKSRQVELRIFVSGVLAIIWSMLAAMILSYSGINTLGELLLPIIAASKIWINLRLKTHISFSELKETASSGSSNNQRDELLIITDKE